jgi:uncharacterized protein (DUF697 family)
MILYSIFIAGGVIAAAAVGAYAWVFAYEGVCVDECNTEEKACFWLGALNVNF